MAEPLGDGQRAVGTRGRGVIAAGAQKASPESPCSLCYQVLRRPQAKPALWRAAAARRLGTGDRPVQPTYLLLDEPFSGLDLVTKAALLKEISTLATERKLTVVLVTHDPMEATALCRSARVLENWTCGRRRSAGGPLTYPFLFLLTLIYMPLRVVCLWNGSITWSLTDRGSSSS